MKNKAKKKTLQKNPTKNKRININVSIFVLFLNLTDST